MNTSPLLRIEHLTHGPIQSLSFDWPAGLSWVCGDEGSGKTTLLRLLAGDLAPSAGHVQAPAAGVFWADLQTSAHDASTVQACWQSLSSSHPQWDMGLQEDLCEALGMAPHRDKSLYMLSAGSRRKVGLIAALAAGTAVTLLDQPFAALDRTCIHLLHEFLREAADHTSRAWIVADYEVPAHLPQATRLDLSGASRA